MTLVLEGNHRALPLARLNGHRENDEPNANQDVETSFSDINIQNEQALSKEYAAIGRFINAKEPVSCRCSSPSSKSTTGFTQRGYLTILSLGRLLTSDPSLAELASILLVHTVLLENLSLSDRRLTVNRKAAKSYSQLSSLVERFSKTANSVLVEESWARLMEFGNVKCDVADLIDGRLLQMSTNYDHQKLLTNVPASSFESLAHALCTVCDIHLKLRIGDDEKQDMAATPDKTPLDNLAILPFSNTVFDKHLVSINIVCAKPTLDPQMGRIHREITHWHNAKRPLIVKAAVPVNPREAKRIMKRNDFFMAEMQSYAASLTNATGKSLEPEIVTVSDKPPNKGPKSNDSGNIAEANAKSSGTKPSKGKASGKKPTGKQVMMNDIAANKAAKDSESVEKIFSSWRIVRMDLAAEKSLQSQYAKMTAYLNNLSEQKRAVLKAEVQWNLLNVLLAMYTILHKDNGSHNSSEKYGIAAMLFDTVRKLLTTEGLTKTIASQIQIVIKALRLPSIDVVMPAADRKLAYDPTMRLTGKGELDLGLEPHEFQLAHAGPYMDRNLDSAPDSRVPFEPDGWQRKVLDELDQDHSIFVVAPTSAGKTFISFYAMERILRANDDSVLSKSQGAQHTQLVH